MNDKAKRGALSEERMRRMQHVAQHVISVLRVKNPKYGESWKSKGGVSAFNNLDRKWSRLATMIEDYDHDIFRAIRETADQPDGMLETLSDLMGYGLLILEDQADVVPLPQPNEYGSGLRTREGQS